MNNMIILMEHFNDYFDWYSVGSNTILKFWYIDKLLWLLITYLGTKIIGKVSIFNELHSSCYNKK